MHGYAAPPDPDIEEFHAAQRRARRALVVRAVKALLLAAVSLAVGGAVAFKIATWEERQNTERLARYEAGQVVVIRRGSNVHDTSPSPFLALGAGGGVALVLFAVGSALVLRDRTYLRALRMLAD